MSSVEVQDVMAVRSRVSWGAVFAGAVVALAVSLLLSMLGVAFGLTAVDQNVGTWTGVWAIVTTLIALFVGGWITTLCAVGENKLEAVVHGVLLWGVVFAMFLWLLAGGIRLGVTEVMGTTSAGTTGLSAEQLQQMGLTQEQINQLRTDPQTTEAAWWSFFGVLLSMVAAIAGALLGAGPTLALRIFGERFAVSGTRYESREHVHH